MLYIGIALQVNLLYKQQLSICLCEYVNQNRLNNVISHLGPINGYEHFSKYIKEFTLDYLKDFRRENFKDIDEMELKYSRKQMKVIYNQANKNASCLLREYIMKLKRMGK